MSTAASASSLVMLASWQRIATVIAEAMDGKRSWAEARNSYADQFEALLPAPAGVTYSTVDMDGVSAMLVTPDGLNVDDGRVVFYMHGGGYVHNAPRAYKSLAGQVALKLRARIYVPDYRQAPEHPFPTPIDDTFRAYRALFSAYKHRPNKVVLMGDSAGGAMVVTMMRRAKDSSVPLPLAGVAFSPWADLAHSGASAKSREGVDPLCTVGFLKQLAATFLKGTVPPTHSDVSPMYATDLQGLPPILIQMGEREVMLSGGITLAERLAEQKVRVTLEVWPAMFHVWQLFAGGYMPEADEALDNAVHFLEREYARRAA